MAYRIVYGSIPQISNRARTNSLRLRVLTAAFLLIFMLVVKQAWPEGTRMLRSFLIPGDPTVTEQAMQTLIMDLRQGEEFSDAVTVFCRQIIENGQSD